MLQPWLRRAYRPLRGRTSWPTSVAAVTVVAPSVPPSRVWLLRLAGAVLVAVPTVATTNWLGPRRTEAPWLTALARLTQKAAGVGAATLSKTSGLRPGRVRMRRQVPAWDPFDRLMPMLLPSDPE